MVQAHLKLLKPEQVNAKVKEYGYTVDQAMGSVGHLFGQFLG
jgi:hypothetical protein